MAFSNMPNALKKFVLYRRMSHSIKKVTDRKNEENIISIECGYLIFLLKPVGTMATALLPPLDVAILHFQVYVYSALSLNLGLL
jgi:hypothetical protein